MEALKKEITQICDQFMREEQGNRLSQFSMMAFKGMLLGAIDKCEKRNGIQKLGKKIRELPKKEDKDNAGRN